MTTTAANGEYRLPLLPPGDYELTFTSTGLTTLTRQVEVLLQQNTTLNVTMSTAALQEQIDVVGEATLIDATSAELKATLADEVITQVPLGQEYRDLVKLIPGVQYTEDSVRGPSAGGSGQDNVYQFDGVNVGLPLFGTLSAEPSSYDVDQVSVVKGGAKAVDFNRSGGFTINSVSKSGTNELHGGVSYRVQTEGLTGARVDPSSVEFEENRSWTVFNLGGPLIGERLFFYTSYYRPTATRENRANVYGNPADRKEEREELFGKLTYTPTDSLLLHASYRDSERVVRRRRVGEFSHPSVSSGLEAGLEIALLEGSWVISDSSFLSIKYSDFGDETLERPDNPFDFDIRIDGSVRLEVSDLDQQGLFIVPKPLEGEVAYNQFVAPLIERYGYLDNGVPRGGGAVGGDSTIRDSDFFRESVQIEYDHLFTGNVTHELHLGYQWSLDEEDRARYSNGWGYIRVPGGRFTTADGTPYFYEAQFQQMSIADEVAVVDPVIHSELESQSIEIHDTIRLNDWTFNAGLLVSSDNLFGQGLRENSANSSGFELAPGNKYSMREVGWEEMIQPRLGVIWAYNSGDTLYANYARYHPAASSLPRAASWARNMRRALWARFDADGNLLEVDPPDPSMGKLFADDLDPRFIDEYLVGTSSQLSAQWSARAYARYRYAANFWEDTNNDARLRFDPPPGIPRELYIPNLNELREEIGGSSYVIAELDGAFTKYYEVSLDAEWRGRSSYFRGSYVWSHYYGNFDQDNSAGNNDANIFIGASYIADGGGRQIWDNRYGNLRGDRRHLLKLYGYYHLPWNGTVGVYAIYQSGQPWAVWDVEAYREYTRSTSDTSRFAEPAGCRVTSDHWQLDFNYTQNFPLGDRYNVQLRTELFNVFNRQTGYDVEPRRSRAGFGEPKDFFDPRRLQLAVKLQF